ncbi:hypothetical protein KKC04_03380 [Patescibacteria group bacterium]|nr:hypothetical protein [Patescibacteria group bacterium]
MALVDSEENLSWQEEITSRGCGGQPRDETEYFCEEILPNISEKEKEEVINFLVKIFYC